MFIKNGHLSWCPTLVEPCKCKISGYIFVTILALAIASLEFYGNIESKSLALLGDAWHATSDSLVYLVAIMGSVIAIKKPSRAKAVKRVWANRNATILIAVALTTMLLALWRIIHPLRIEIGVMLTIGSIGLAFNLAMYFILKAFRIEHDHDSDHDHLHDTAIWHTIVDLLISLVVVMSAWLMILYPPSVLWRTDTVASIVICLALIVIALKTKREIKKHSGHDHKH